MMMWKTKVWAQVDQATFIVNLTHVLKNTIMNIIYYTFSKSSVDLAVDRWNGFSKIRVICIA